MNFNDKLTFQQYKTSIEAMERFKSEQGEKWGKLQKQIASAFASSLMNVPWMDSEQAGQGTVDEWSDLHDRALHMSEGIGHADMDPNAAAAYLVDVLGVGEEPKTDGRKKRQRNSEGRYKPRTVFKLDEFELTELPQFDSDEMNRLCDLARAVKIEPKNLQTYVERANEVHAAASFYFGELQKIRRSGLVPMPVASTEKIVPHSWHERLATDVQLGRTVAVRGPAGNGKSTGVAHVLKSLGYTIYHLDCTDSTTAEQLVGGLQPRPDGKGALEMVYMPGVISRAFADPKGAIQLDEFDALDPRIALTIQSALHRANGHKRWLSAPDHPEGGIRAAGLCPVVVTMNTWGAGANREYVGRNILDAASLDRFSTVIDTDYENEADMLKMHGASDYVAKTLVDDAITVRKIINENALRVLLSTRRLLDLAESVTVLKCDVASAWDRDFFSRIQPDQRQTIKSKLPRSLGRKAA